MITYAGIYATIGTVLRPFRFALAVGSTPVFTAFVQRVRGALPFAESRPALNRTLALVLITLLLNVAGTTGIITAGVWLAGINTGVPAFPPGFQLPFGR